MANEAADRVPAVVTRTGRRRQFSEEDKRRIVEEICRPGESLSAVARRWVASPTSAAADFLASIREIGSTARPRWPTEVIEIVQAFGPQARQHGDVHNRCGGTPAHIATAQEAWRPTRMAV
jgi:hypothetical protein